MTSRTHRENVVDDSKELVHRGPQVRVERVDVPAKVCVPTIVGKVPHSPAFEGRAVPCSTARFPRGAPHVSLQRQQATHMRYVRSADRQPISGSDAKRPSEWLRAGEWLGGGGGGRNGRRRPVAAMGGRRRTRAPSAETPVVAHWWAMPTSANPCVVVVAATATGSTAVGAPRAPQTSASTTVHASLRRLLILTMGSRSRGIR